VIDEAVAALRAGKLAILPTDTVYGLAASAGDEAAVRRLYDAKGRGEQQPTALRRSPAHSSRAPTRSCCRTRHAGTPG
jgi:tRNA A37 threonylcarbamoyladenosine synthetase subunit TsaC/SUA5/YrdC